MSDYPSKAIEIDSSVQSVDPASGGWDETTAF